MVKFSSVILSAGNGTRFLSETPKILHKIGNAPLFLHIINTVTKIGCDNIILVTDISYNTSRYTKNFNNVTEVYQKEKLGTGHALQIAYKSVNKDSEYVALLYGDTPLITENTISSAIEKINNDNARYGFEILEGPKSLMTSEYIEQKEVLMLENMFGENANV